MIEGAVNDRYEATVQLSVIRPDGEERRVETVIDTGFNGSLTLQPELIRAFDLEWLGREQGILGDGSKGLFDIYAATVSWDGRERRVETIEADAQPLLGMEMLRGHELRIRVVEGGGVRIDSLG